MRVSGFRAQETGFKSWFWWSSTTMALSSIRQLTQIIRSRPVLGGNGEGICSLKFPSCHRVWYGQGGLPISLGCPQSLYHVDREATTMPTIWLNWRKSYQILPMEMKGNLLRSGWMVPEERVLKRSIMNLRNGLKTIRDLQGDCLIFQQKAPASAGLAMKEGMQVIHCGKRSILTN